LLFLIKKFFFILQKLQVANGPAHLHPVLIIIIASFGNDESILLAMGSIKFYLFIYLFFFFP